MDPALLICLTTPPPEVEDDNNYHLPPECYTIAFKDCIPLLVMCGIGLIGVVAILYFGN